jgi:hypothetical protein
MGAVTGDLGHQSPITIALQNCVAHHIAVALYTAKGCLLLRENGIAVVDAMVIMSRRRGTYARCAFDAMAALCTTRSRRSVRRSANASSGRSARGPL